MEAQIKNTSFLYTCKENYFLGILPVDPKSQNKDGYKALVAIAKTYFSVGLYEPIAQYLNEGRYFLKLWSAYLTLEYGNPTNELRENCIETIHDTMNQFSNELTPEQGAFFQEYLQQKFNRV